MTAAALAALVALAAARKARDLARLEALIAEARAIEDAIAGLAGTHGRDLAAAAEVPLAVHARRIAWADAEIAARRRRLGAIALEIAEVRAAARLSLGKHEALLALHARAAQGERAAGERAEEIAAFSARVGRGALGDQTSR